MIIGGLSHGLGHGLGLGLCLQRCRSETCNSQTIFKVPCLNQVPIGPIFAQDNGYLRA